MILTTYVWWRPGQIECNKRARNSRAPAGSRHFINLWGDIIVRPSILKYISQKDHFKMIGTLFLITIVLLYLYVRKRHNYFAEHGIPSSPGIFPLGKKALAFFRMFENTNWIWILGSSIIWKCFTGKVSILQVADDLFGEFPKTKAFGYYKAFGEPVLALKDLELAKRIMVRDFEHFIDRNFLNIHPGANKYTGLFLANIKGIIFRSLASNLITFTIFMIVFRRALERSQKSFDPHVYFK